MKCVDVELGAHPIIAVERKFLWWRRVTRYKSTGSIAGHFHKWVELPNMKIVTNLLLSWQLDEWLQDAERTSGKRK